MLPALVVLLSLFKILVRLGTEEKRRKPQNEQYDFHAVNILVTLYINCISEHIKFKMKVTQTSGQKVNFQLKFEICWQIFSF